MFFFSLFDGWIIKSHTFLVSLRTLCGKVGRAAEEYAQKKVNGELKSSRTAVDFVRDLNYTKTIVQLIELFWLDAR